jgi:Ni,Fe-hydrogenase maturation factor
MVHSLGGKTGPLWLLGCEPGPLESEEGALGLSPVVEAAVAPAIARIEKFITDFPSLTVPELKEVS